MTRPMLAIALLLFAGSAAAAGDAALSRIGDSAKPTREDVRLVLDPSKPDYSGSVTIALTIPEKTNEIRFTAEDMTLGKVTLQTTKAGAKPIAHVIQPGEHGLQFLRAAKPLAPGDYRLTIEFTNDYNTQATSLYRLKSGDDWYAFTQFEADDAREAFPCFDEPEFKIPWNVTVSARGPDMVVGNTPIASEKADGALKTTVFKETRPLPSYLVALSVGPLESIPIEGMSMPGRVITVKGQTALAAEAARITPPIIGALESYFGRPYPYEKLDLVAVPEFWPGAMENAGQITFADQGLLMDSGRASETQKRRQASVIAHECAHMWFGDLVTMRWWDDLWLNESFASWMGEKVTNQVFPEMGIDLRLVSDADDAMRTDGRLTTRAIRQPVNSLANLLQSADVLAYKKGQTLLGMFERWVGEEKFREGVRDYLSAHAWGNATASDLFAALSKAAGRDIGAPMSSFLDQPGMPLVTIEPLEGGKVKLSQERFLPANAERPAAQTWQIPMILNFDDGTGEKTKTVLLTQASEVVDLGVAKIDWIAPNGGGAGYYRWKLPPRELVQLADEAARVLEPRERMEYAYDGKALLDAGALHADGYLQVLPRLLRDEEPMVVTAALDGLDAIHDPLITPDVEEPFAHWVRASVGPSLVRFGRTPRVGEAATVALVRPRLLTTMADEGDDAATQAFGDSLAHAYLADPSKVDPGLALPALQIAAMRGDAALNDRLKQAFEAAKQPADRRMYLTALGWFRDPKIVTSNLEYALAGPLKPQEIGALMLNVNLYTPNRDASWSWLQKNYDTIMKRIPPMYGAFMPGYAGGCSSERIEEGKKFFADPDHQPPGYAKELARVTEVTANCLDLRAREGERVKAYLTRSLASTP